MSQPGAKGRTRRTSVLWRVLDGRNGAMTRCQARGKATAPRGRRTRKRSCASPSVAAHATTAANWSSAPMRADRALPTDACPVTGMARAAAGERAPDLPAAAARAMLARTAPESGRRDVREVGRSTGVGIRHPSLVSNVLARRERDGLAHTHRGRRSLNAWQLTDQGAAVEAGLPQGIYEQPGLGAAAGDRSRVCRPSVGLARRAPTA